MFSFSPAIPARGDLDWCWYLRRQGKSGEALERLLHDIGVMDPSGWAPWASSTLTYTGAPVEISYAAGQSDLRIVTEVADPASDPADRMGQVCQVMRRLGCVGPSPDVRDVIGAAQAGGPLTFGARLGLTHGADGLRCQLLAELPKGASDLLGLLRSDRQADLITRLSTVAQATQVEVDCETGAVTLHCKISAPTADSLTTLAQAANVCADGLKQAVKALTGPTAAFPFQSLWVCVAEDAKGDGPPIVTLYFAASDLCSTDAEIARRIKSAGGDVIPAYVQLVDTLQPAPVNFTHHGKIGLTARQGAAPALSVHVAAPWLCPFDTETGAF